MAYKRKRFAISQPDCSSLHPDLLNLILEKLSFTNKFRFQAVCHSWCSIANTHISSLIRTVRSQPPLLMLPSNQNIEDSNDRSFFNLENKKWRKIKDLPREFDQRQCIGSSNGWLLFLGKDKENHYLFNPFLDAEIKFGNLPKLPLITNKVALWSDPICNNNNFNFVIVAVHDIITRSCISYAIYGGDSWRRLEHGSKTSYCDIVYHNHLIYALTESCSVEAWDFCASIPTKVINISLGYPQESIADIDMYTRRFYLVESQGEFFLFKRYIGNHVRDDDIVVQEGDMIDYEHEGYGFQYMTKFFDVFKLDFTKDEWVKVESLGDKVAFLGGNNSVLVQAEDFKGYEKNSIYFTDDNWDVIDLDDDSGGHDMGKYSLKDGSIEKFFDSTCMKPPPFWVIPR